MKILGLDPQESLGSVIAQTYNLPGKTISKGTFVTSEIVEYFKEVDVQNILCAVPENGDIHEDEAANIISNEIDRSHIYVGSISSGSYVSATLTGDGSDNTSYEDGSILIVERLS